MISTLPASANFTLPESAFPTFYQQTSPPPVILDVVYKPVWTALLQQAKTQNSLFVQGATMLLEQGLAQFEIWHERRAPRDVMTTTIFSQVEKIDNVH